MALINAKDEIRIEFDETNLFKKQLLCKVLKVEKDVLELDYSNISPYYFQFLTEGTEFKLLSYTPNGINIFDSIIINSPIDRKFEVEYPPRYRCIQRRGYFRTNIALDIYVNDSRKQTIEKGKTINIAGNGVKFVMYKRLVFGKMYEIYLFLSKENCVKLTGSIIAIEGNDYVIEFTKIAPQDRDKIIRLCIKEQSKTINRKKNSL